MVKLSHLSAIALVLIHFTLAGVALAADKSVSITPSTSGEPGSSTSFGGMTFTAQNVRLQDAFARMLPDKLWPSDAAKALPEGRFDITMEGYAPKDPAAFEALAAEVKKQFGVEVTVVEEERDGYTLALPNADKVTKADSNEGFMMMTTAKGWSLQAATLKDVAEWLSKEIDAPVMPKDATDARYSFELTVSVFKPQELPAALEKLGFVVAKEKVKVKVLKAS